MDVTVRVVSAGTTTVLETTTVTTDVEVDGMALLSVTVVTSVGAAGVPVTVAVLLTALMQTQADEYSARSAQLEATGNKAEVDEVASGVDVVSGVDSVEVASEVQVASGVDSVEVASGIEVASGVDSVEIRDEVGLQPRFFLMLRFLTKPAVGAVATSVTVAMLVAE